MRVSTSADGDNWSLGYSHPERLDQYLREVTELLQSANGVSAEADLRAAAQVLFEIAKGHHGDADNRLNADSGLSSDVRRAIRKSLNEGFLRSLDCEWTTHGITRSFRFWSNAEIVPYLHCANEVVRHLRKVSPNVCYGFGFVLGMLRGGSFIPHDNDVDVLIAIKREECTGLSSLLARVKAFLESWGYLVHGRTSTIFM